MASPAKVYTKEYTGVPKQPFPKGHVNRLPSLACGDLFERGKRFGWWYGVRSPKRLDSFYNIAKQNLQ